MQRPRGLSNLQYANDIRTLFTAVRGRGGGGVVLFGSAVPWQLPHSQCRPEGQLLIAARSRVRNSTIENPFIKCCLVII